MARALAALLVVVLGLLAPAAVAPAGAAEPEWNIARVGAPASAIGVTIAVVDTGVDPNHPAFAGRVLPTIDVVGDGRSGDPQGHGTHVAGTAAGADAGCGSIGVAPDARILPVRVLDERGRGTVSGVVEGVRRAVDAGADVVNLSLGPEVSILGGDGADGLVEAIEYAWSNGAIPVLAAGNGDLLTGFFNSGYGDIPAIVVTATDNRDRLASYAFAVGSARWGLAAPGGDASGRPGADVLSAFPDRRCALSAGTSMAAPHVAGAAAALRARGLSPQQTVDRLLSTARDIGPQRTYGAGLLDLRAAIGSAPSQTTVPPSTTPPSTTAAPAAPSSAAVGTPTPVVPPSAPSTTGAVDPTTALPAPSTSTSPPPTEPPTSSTSTLPPEETAAVMIEDEPRDVPGVLAAVAAASALATAAGVVALRRRL